MKHTALLLLLATTIAFTSCSDSAILPEVPESGNLSRSIVPIEDSETNPNLLTDWENCTDIYLNEKSDGELISEVAPWGNGVTTRLENHFRTDIKKSDGWIMLFHTFTRANKSIGQAYMCFYNQFSGYVKVFYYATETNDVTNSVWDVTSADNIARPLFSDNEYFSQPIDCDDNYTIRSITAENKVTRKETGIQRGWNGFEFRVGAYNPKNSEGTFSFDAINSTITQTNFNGEELSTTTGTITTINTNDKETADNAIIKAVANQAGEEAKNAIDKFARSHLDKNFIGLNFASILAKVTVGDYAGAITSGLGAVFKSIFKKDPQYSVSEVKLQTHGTVTLDGTSKTTTVANVNALTFNLKEILDCNRPIDIDTTRRVFATIARRLDRTIKLGVWNLKKKPTVYYERYTEFHDEVGLPQDFGGGAIDFHGMLDYPQTKVGDIEIVFNPAIAKYVKSYSTTTCLIDVVGGNRTIDNKNKRTIDLNISNKLTESDGITVYGVSKDKRDVYFMLDAPTTDLINNSTTLYMDWGENVGGNRAAVVTLTMNINYKGKELSFTESRVYDVVYAPTTNGLDFSFFNNPPYSYVANQKGSAIYCSNF